MKKLSIFKQTGFKWLWVTLLIILIDQLTKQKILSSLSLYETIPLISFFNLTLATNKGAAFSFLSQSGHLGFWVLSLFAALVTFMMIIWLYRTPHDKTLLSIGIALIIGGATGNLIDRVIYGHVIDFLDFYLGSWHWPAFNIADSAIVVGAFLLVIDFFKKNK